MSERTVDRLRRLVSEYGLTFKQAAQSLGLSYAYVRRLACKHEIYRYGSRKGNKNCYLQQCPQCFKETLFRDVEGGELVCKSCGFVLEREPDMVHRLPFNETYAVENHLAFGKSLGGTAPKQLFRVLARAPAGRKDLPVRATQIQVISNAVDPPVVKGMLEYGSRMLRELGLDKDTEECHLLADRYGRLLRKLGAFIQVSRINVKPYLVARAALCFLLPDKAEVVATRFKFPPQYFALVSKIAELSCLEAQGKR